VKYDGPTHSFDGIVNPLIIASVLRGLVMAKKKVAKKTAIKKQATKKQTTPKAKRQLTSADHQKIDRLLSTTEPDHVRLAFELTDATCRPSDVTQIYTDETILLLISTGDIELFAITAAFCLTYKELWERFLVCANSSKVLTANVVRIRTADLSEFTAITEDAAALGPSKTQSWGDDVDLGGLSTISLPVVKQLVRHSSNLSLSGLTTISDEVARVLATHKGDGLVLNGLTDLSEAAAQSLCKYKGGGGYMSGLHLSGLVNISDAVAENFGKHRGSLTLDGLTSLTDVAAKSLAKQKGELSLNGIRSLSVEAAKHLAQHDGTISLCGVSNLSDEAAAEFGNNESLKTRGDIQDQIAKALKRFTSNSRTLTPAQRKAINKLVTVEHLSTACELLNSAGAAEGDWLAVFPRTKIKQLLDSWDADTWNTLVAEMQTVPKVYELLKAAMEKRINYCGSDWSVYRRYGDQLKPVIRKSSKELKALINRLLTSRGMRTEVGFKEK